MKKHLLTIGLIASASLANAQNLNQPPVMGWSSWNTFDVHISEELINGQADAMVSQGLKDAGYNYINIDDGYFGLRDDEGNLMTHPFRFPNGLRGIVDHVHSLGLKAGIYSDAGSNTCGSGQGTDDKWGMGVGLFGHEKMDCEFFFNDLGFDFIKVDFCGGQALLDRAKTDLDERQRYTSISNSLKATGKEISFNVCRWAYPGTWIHDVADSWRTTGDIWCDWTSVRDILAENLYLSAYSSYGHYNDMDMLEVGRNMSEIEDRTHFGMWCIMNSPLLIGCDMRTIPAPALELMKNKELIALNQDRLGEQAYVAAKIGDCFVLVRDIEQAQSGIRAVAIYNPSDDAAHITLPLETIDLAGKTAIRDLFDHKDLKAITNGNLVCDVPAHGTMIYRLEAEKRLERKVYEAETAFISDYQELENPYARFSGFYEYKPFASSGILAVNLGRTEENDLCWKRIYSKEGGEYTAIIYLSSKEDRNFTVEVNGKKAARLTGNSSAWDRIVPVETKVTLKPGLNEIRLYNAGERMPNIDKLEIIKL